MCVCDCVRVCVCVCVYVCVCVCVCVLLYCNTRFPQTDKDFSVTSVTDLLNTELLNLLFWSELTGLDLCWNRAK